MTVAPGRPRVVMVTGASSGIGLATALAVARSGDHVVLAARDESALKQTESACLEAGAASTRAVPTDVGDDESVRRCVAVALEITGGLDLVVHAAGVVSYGRVETVPPQVWEGVLRANVLGSVNVARHALPEMRGRERGTLVLLGSVIGHIGVPGMSPYVVSKWGVRALARQLQLENRDRPGVHVVYVAPGGVDTPIYDVGGNYLGFAGRPPPPVTTPERVAQRILRAARHPRPRVQVGLANDLMRFGFSAFPALYDALVGPLFSLAAQDRSAPVPPRPGNVLSPTPDDYGLRGRPGGSFGVIAGNVRRRLSR